MNNRIECLKKILNENEIDGMLVFNPLNIRYLTGLNVEGFLIINECESTFVTDSRYIEDVNNKLTIEDEIIAADIADLRQEDYLNFFTNCNRIGFEEHFVTYSTYNEMIRKYRIK